nr:MAG TPA: hypothetical protein [Caudoviricetes sp.]
MISSNVIASFSMCPPSSPFMLFIIPPLVIICKMRKMIRGELLWAILLFEIAKYYAKGRPRYMVAVILRLESPLQLPSVRPRGP